MNLVVVIMGRRSSVKIIRTISGVVEIEGLSSWFDGILQHLADGYAASRWYKVGNTRRLG